MSDSATGLRRAPPMLKDEASALDFAGRMAYADSIHPPEREVGVPETTAYDAWVIAADANTPEAGFGMATRYFVAPNITSGYWKNRGATHIRRFPIPTVEQEIRDPAVSYDKPTDPPPSPVDVHPDAMSALKTALLLAVRAVECLEHPPTPTPPASDSDSDSDSDALVLELPKVSRPPVSDLENEADKQVAAHADAGLDYQDDLA